MCQEFLWTFAKLWEYKEKKATLIIDQYAQDHIHQRHGAWIWAWTQFSDTTEMYTFLNDGFHIEQKQWKEYRWWDVLWKYNITAKEISNGIFRAITIFPKRKK